VQWNGIFIYSKVESISEKKAIPLHLSAYKICRTLAKKFKTLNISRRKLISSADLSLGRFCSTQSCHGPNMRGQSVQSRSYGA